MSWRRDSESLPAAQRESCWTTLTNSRKSRAASKIRGLGCARDATNGVPPRIFGRVAHTPFSSGVAPYAEPPIEHCRATFPVDLRGGDDDGLRGGNSPRLDRCGAATPRSGRRRSRILRDRHPSAVRQALREVSRPDEAVGRIAAGRSRAPAEGGGLRPGHRAGKPRKKRADPGGSAGGGPSDAPRQPAFLRARWPHWRPGSPEARRGQRKAPRVPNWQPVGNHTGRSNRSNR